MTNIEETNFQPDEPSSEVKVWKYMDFPKFLLMLYKNSLFMPRMIKLDDKYELMPSRLRFKTAIGDFHMDESTPRINHLKERAKHLVSCWHMGEDNESDAMWKIYAKENGIAISTSFQKLKDYFQNEENILLGKVNYSDDDTRPIPFAFRKRKPFKHEKEVRAVIYDSTAAAYVDAHFRDYTEYGDHYFIMGMPENVKHGCWIGSDFNQIIEKIHVGPNSFIDYELAVKELLDHFEINAEVIRSTLNAPEDSEYFDNSG